MAKSCRNISDKTIARFWAKVQRSEGCWLWTSNVVRDYGQFALGRIDGKQRNIYAHQFAYAITYGDIPAGQNVCHRCDTPLCVRPDHLFLGTQQENLTDARQKRRLREWMPRKPLSLEAYAEILLTKARGIDLVRKYGVTKTTISRIRNGKQGVRAAQLVLQGQPGQSQPSSARADVSHQVLKPVHVGLR